MRCWCMASVSLACGFKRAQLGLVGLEIVLLGVRLGLARGPFGVGNHGVIRGILELFVIVLRHGGVGCEAFKLFFHVRLLFFEGLARLVELVIFVEDLS